MQYACDLEGQRLEPSPKTRAQCPACRAEVLSKCGQINVWHWSHISADCDHWSEPESEWHRTWKELVPPEQREVVIDNHRADIVQASGAVVELQHSFISPEEIAEREAHYKDMIWLFDASGEFEVLAHALDKYWHFRWKRARKSVCFCDKPVFLDHGNEILIIDKITDFAPHFGYCRRIPKHQFCNWLAAGGDQEFDFISPPTKQRPVPPSRFTPNDIARHRIRMYVNAEKFLIRRKLLGAKTPSGWRPLQCPWKEEHIPGNDTKAGVAEPGPKNNFHGAFYCRSCLTKRGWRNLTDWIADLAALEVGDV